MKIISLLLASCLCLFAAGNANAQLFLKKADGNDLLGRCRLGVDREPQGSDEFASFASCASFIEGVRQASVASAAIACQKQLLCMPAEVSNGQMIRVAVKWMQDHRAELHLPAGILAIRAWREAFPCGGP